MKKKNKLNNFVIISIYFTILLTISIAYSFFNTNLSIKTAAKLTGDNNNSEYILVAAWEANGAYYYHYTVNFNYTDTTPTIGWKYYIKIPYDTEVVGCFSAASCDVNGEVLTITNDQTNRVLSPDNQTASFSFQIKTNRKDYTFETIGTHFITDSTNVFDEKDNTINKLNIVDYLNPTLNITGGFGNTTTYLLKVTNSSDSIDINTWSAKIKFPSNSHIESLWGGEYEYDEKNGELTIHPPLWNPILNKNSTQEVNIYMKTPYENPYTPTIIGFNATTTNEEDVDANINIVGGVS